MSGGPHNALGQSYAFLAITPIVAGHEIALRAHLRGLPRGEGSPLARVPRTHFGRWVIMPQPAFQGSPMHPDPFKSQYLFFSACFDGDLPSYLDDLCTLIPDEADAIWGHCAGYPTGGTRDRAAFARYLTHNQVDTEVYFAAYPQATVAKVRESLALRDQVLKFTVEAQGLDDAELQRRWQEAFGAGAR